VASKKTLVIEKLFFERFDSATNTLSDPVVTLEQAEAATRRWGNGLSPRNPANFMKDIVRSPNRNKLFPGAVVREGWTVRQDPGSGKCFRFVSLDPEQETAFLTTEPDPDLLTIPI
jgi:hypothetical protein